MNAVASYWEELTRTVGEAWNRFWFTPAPVSGWGRMRLLVGIMSVWFLVSHVGDLRTWFGPHGLLPADVVRQATAFEDSQWNGRLSYLLGVEDPRLLMLVHAAGIAVALAFTVGFATRVTSVLTLVVVLSYVHRAPMITGPFEPVLTMALFYLCLAPGHIAYSVDRRLRRKAGRPELPEESVAANVVWRMLQVHLSAFYLMLGLTKLAGDVWWSGEAMWWLIAHTESRLVDLTFLHSHPYLLNLWTHGVVAFELAFGLLIWNRLARPLLLALALVHWIALGMVTGLLSYAAMMVIVSGCFRGRDRTR